MSKVAIVVQRCHESVVGGSEALAWQYAEMLSEAFDVDILTTTAVDYATWSNVLPAGIERRQGIDIHRFPVSITRSAYWHELHARWLRHYPHGPVASVETAAARPGPWTIALEEEFIRKQGPYSASLLAFLKTHGRAYRAVIFVTYLYPTTYFGTACVASSRALLVPTLHNEPVAYMKAFRMMARRMRGLIWLTEAEKQFSDSLWGSLRGEVIALPVETESVAPAQLGYPYLLYSGRIDEGKGCHQLIDYFTRMKQSDPSPLRLVLTGPDKIGLPSHPDVVYLGEVSSQEKSALMAGALLFVMPSRCESFSIATLEAMAQRTPTLVNGDCRVLVEHVDQSGAGKAFVDWAGFCAAVRELTGNNQRLEVMGRKAREYVRSRFAREQIRNRLIALVKKRFRDAAAQPEIRAEKGPDTFSAKEEG
jgi:glycosyltransferase involved in cell wall biosynthesis